MNQAIKVFINNNLIYQKKEYFSVDISEYL